MDYQEYYDVAQICLNGHCITKETREHPEDQQKFCHQCGAETITACPACHAAIKGCLQTPGLPNVWDYEVPAYCPNCGKPYPWTKARIDAIAELIREDENMQETAQEALVVSLPDIIAETPKTNLAIARIQKALVAAGKFTAEGIRQFVIDFGCELVKSQLGM